MFQWLWNKLWLAHYEYTLYHGRTNKHTETNDSINCNVCLYLLEMKAGTGLLVLIFNKINYEDHDVLELVNK